MPYYAMTVDNDNYTVKISKFDIAAKLEAVEREIRAGNLQSVISIDTNTPVQYCVNDDFALFEDDDEATARADYRDW